MPILGSVGKKHSSQRAARVGVYALLTLGALAIVFPLLIVLGQTMSDRFDLRDNAIVPCYLYDRGELVLKHIYAKSNRVDMLATRHHRTQWKNQAAMRDDEAFYVTRASAFNAEGLQLEAWEPIVSDLNEFKKTLAPDRILISAFRIEDYFRPFLFAKYGQAADGFLKKYATTRTLPAWFIRSFPDGDRQVEILDDRAALGLAIMNHELRANYVNFYAVEVVREGNWPAPFWRTGRRPKDELWTEFKNTLPPDQKMVIPSDAYWQFYLKMTYQNAAELNKAWGTAYEGLMEIRFPFQPPDPPAMRRDWETFMLKRWPRRILKISGDHGPAWRTYVRKQLTGKFKKTDSTGAKALKEAARMSGADRALNRWEDLNFPSVLPEDETLARYWCEFTASGVVPLSDFKPDAPELRFQTFLRKKYRGEQDETGALPALNAAWHSRFARFEDVPLPLALADFAPAYFHPWRMRWSFMTESYERVAEYIFGRGQAAKNTLILVVFSLISALTINPIAAYSLSRFSMKHASKILLFFLATMAFPAEVAMIPNFLLLRDFGLLNTYAALILPGMANGFAIFLLKGFFDSLPQELYQAAEIDGASEFQVFRLVAMPLVTPILAYIGLNTFVAAYSSFMWAFVICPEQEMWTLMVWVYDFQTKSPGNNYVMAATVLVCIPPLLVFLFANRIIMKGIVIPSMK